MTSTERDQSIGNSNLSASRTDLVKDPLQKFVAEIRLNTMQEVPKLISQPV